MEKRCKNVGLWNWEGIASLSNLGFRAEVELGNTGFWESGLDAILTYRLVMLSSLLRPWCTKSNGLEETRGTRWREGTNKSSACVCLLVTLVTSNVTNNANIEMLASVYLSMLSLSCNNIGFPLRCSGFLPLPQPLRVMSTCQMVTPFYKCIHGGCANYHQLTRNNQWLNSAHNYKDSECQTKCRSRQISTVTWL